LAQICLVVFEKNVKTANSDTLQLRKSDVTEPKARKLDYSNNNLNYLQVKVSFRLSKTILISGFRKPETDF